MTASPHGGTTKRAARRLRAAARVLVKGAPVPPAAPAPQRKAKPGRPTKNVPGRWIREIHTPDGVEPAVDRRPDDAMEAAAVDAGWLLIDAHERLSINGAQRVFGHEIDAWNRYTDDTITPLVHPAWADAVEIAQQIKHEELPTNRLRYRRTMDFVRAGDRLFDVGYGRGYLASLLVRDAGVESYHGIDIIDDWREMSLATLAANGLADGPVDLSTGDLYDLTRERLEAVGATFVICCEVLEHVPDAEKALKVLADALPDGADLLFSVPLHGRIESVFGHVSVFDVARLKQMLEGAGLHAHHVEPLSNTWSLVVASRDPGPSVRVREATRRPPVRASVPLVQHRDFVDVAPADLAPVGGATLAEHVDAAGRPDPARTAMRLDGSGGVSFPVTGLEALRLELVMPDVEHVTRIAVTVHDDTRRIGEWTWYLADFPVTQPSRRFSLRPGESLGVFQAGPHRDMTSATRVEIRAVLPRGHQAELAVRTAYLP